MKLAPKRLHGKAFLNHSLMVELIMMKKALGRQLLVSFGIIVVAAGAAAYGLYYFSGDLTTQANKIVSDKNLISRQASVVNILAHLKNDAPQAAAYDVAINALLPTHDQLIGFQQWLMDQGRSRGLDISFNFRGDNMAATPTSYGTDGFSLSVSGSEEGVVAFLEEIEIKADAYLLSIDSFDATNDNGTYRLSLQGRVFSRGT